MRWDLVRVAGRVLACASLAWLGWATPAAARDDPPLVDFGRHAHTATVRHLAQWILPRHDAGDRAFAIVDKRQARLYVFDARGRLAGASAALLGSTLGDHTVPGVGARAQSGQVGIDERTTPAGRFDTMPGINLSGEQVVWVDYASAFAIHRVRPGRAFAARQARLASPTPADNRVSYGCVVVSVEFYEQVVQRVLGSGPSVVYVLPESGELQHLLRDLQAQPFVRQPAGTAADAATAAAL
jgi:hypothetical protein